MATVTVQEQTHKTKRARLSNDNPLQQLTQGIPLDPLPPARPLDRSVPHAPARNPQLTAEEKQLAVHNALRYFPSHLHETLAPEFAQELEDHGHIFMHRFRPTYDMRAYPIDHYPANIREAACIQLMIMNNLDPRVAQFPHELITYGGNGSVFQNWAQYHLTMQYLSEMTNDQTLVMNSGHPQGLFPSHVDAPRVVLSNGMVIPNHSSRQDYERMYAQGVTMYGQMTAGSYCYIGPQGIVHGTTLTLLNAGRKYLGEDVPMRGKVYVSSGLGGMSGAQPKAGEIADTIAVIAEINEKALTKRHEQGWVREVCRDLDSCINRIREARANKESTSIAFHGNIVALWERLAEEKELLVDMGSDQTSLHNPYFGGYYPVTLTFEDANKMMSEDPENFKKHVQESLRRQITAIDKLAARGMKFWDYGNSFLLEASRAGADIKGINEGDFKYPTYFQEFMGDIFSLGFGPFRWVCTSGKPEDLLKTDQIAAQVIRELSKKASTRSKQQYNDNLIWIEKADENKMVVGSQARILYSDAEGRSAIALAFNKAVDSGELSGPVVLSRDHHDVSGTDSPFRETSNLTDGSRFCADMAIQNVIGDAFRGATWVSIHNGGGCGWGEVTNGGFGFVLDGSTSASRRAKMMLHWDVNNGVTRRAWARNENANDAIKRAMEQEPRLKVTLHNPSNDDVVARAVQDASRT